MNPTELSLRQRYFTPAEGNVPNAISKSLHRPVPLQIQPPSTVENSNVNKTLDGFALLNATGVGFPDDAKQASLNGKGYNAVVEEDLNFFVNLEYLDVSENQLKLMNFAYMPSLRELRMVCNNISQVTELGGFESLIILDLSYNRMTTRSVQALALLPSLVELDLSGNGLKMLPLEMNRFMTLEHLRLDNNKLDDNISFVKLSTMPKLRHLSLAYNYLSKIPPDCCKEGHFKLLESLNITFNYFSMEEDMMPVSQLLRLASLYIYGNPVLGPTGEDPLQCYVEDFVDSCQSYRASHNTKPMEILTDIPKKKSVKKGKSLGRQAYYHDFPVVEVDTKAKEKSVKEWREDGNKTLFAEAMAAVKKQMAAQGFPEFTFITDQREDEDRAHVVADNVMSRVAADMGLGESAEIDAIDECAKIKTIFDDKPVEERDVEAIPHSLFSRRLGDAQALANPSMSVKTAVRALKYALDHPLSDHNEIPARGLIAASNYVRPTQAYYHRKITKHQTAKEIIEPEKFDQFVNNRKKKGNNNVVSTQNLAAQRTFEQIESVLNRLNSNTDDLTQKSCGHGMNIKENLNMLKAFPRPTTAMKDLVSMVNDIVDELDT